jgi:hypothetical protein
MDPLRRFIGLHQHARFAEVAPREHAPRFPDAIDPAVLDRTALHDDGNGISGLVHAAASVVHQA